MASHLYRDKIRIRANGLLVKNDTVLLVQIHSPVTEELIWTPPGGGLEFGETLEACLRREFIEETGLEVEVNDLMFINELVEPPFHAVEFYFAVTRSGGSLKPGTDPEHHADKQYLQDVQWINLENIDQINLAPPGLAGVLAGDPESASNISLYTSFRREA